MKYFLSIVVFLLSAYNSFSAHDTKATPSLSNKTSTFAAFVHYSIGKSETLDILKTDHESEMTLFEFEEDNEVDAFKKNLKSAGHFVSVFTSTALENSIYNAKDFSFNALRLSRNLAPRYLLLQVFRV